MVTTSVSMELIHGLALLRYALDEEGPRPDLHREVMARHRQEWPRLWEAIDIVRLAIQPTVDA